MKLFITGFTQVFVAINTFYKQSYLWWRSYLWVSNIIYLVMERQKGSIWNDKR